MPIVQTGNLGMGILGSGEGVTWWTNVNPGGVWHFWVDNTTIGPASRVLVDAVHTVRDGNKHHAHIHIRNTFNTTAGFLLRWSAIYP